MSPEKTLPSKELELVNNITPRKLVSFKGNANQLSRNARRLAKIQEIQHLFNSLIDHKIRKQSRDDSVNSNVNTESSLSTILFETHDVPFISANAGKKTTVIEKLPEILDGIKMTTSKLPTESIITKGLTSIYTAGTTTTDATTVKTSQPRTEAPSSRLNINQGNDITTDRKNNLFGNIRFRQKIYSYVNSDLQSPVVRDAHREERDETIDSEASTVSSTLTTQLSANNSTKNMKTNSNQSQSDSKSYFNNMFMYIEKAMNYALKNNNLSTLHDQNGKKSEGTSIKEFEGLKSEMIKETLCVLFEEKGYPKLPQCETHVGLPSQIKKDILLKLSNNLRDVSLSSNGDHSTKSPDESTKNIETTTRQSDIFSRPITKVDGELEIVMTTASYAIDKTSRRLNDLSTTYLLSTEPTFHRSTSKSALTTTNSFTENTETNHSNELTGKRKILRKRIVRKIIPRRKHRKGKARRRKQFRQNKHQDHFELKIPVNTDLEGHFPLHTIKKDINIYNSYGNRAVYYKIYNGGRLFKKYKRKVSSDKVKKNNWSPIIKGKDTKSSINTTYYGPFEYVKLKPHQLSTFSASASNRRESREIYTNPEFKSDYLFKPMQSLPSSKRVEYLSNLFHEDQNTSTNTEWSPITHWTLQEYDPHSFSYTYHNIKLPERKM